MPPSHPPTARLPPIAARRLRESKLREFASIRSRDESLPPAPSRPGAHTRRSQSRQRRVYGDALPCAAKQEQFLPRLAAGQLVERPTYGVVKSVSTRTAANAVAISDKRGDQPSQRKHSCDLFDPHHTLARRHPRRARQANSRCAE